MPFEFNNILVVDQDELIPEHMPSLRALQMKIKRYEDKDYGIKAIQRGGNGRQLLISFDSLDKEIKESIGDPRKAAHLMENWYKTDANAVRFFTGYRFEDGSALSLKHIEEYITNASVLSACVELKKAREFERKTRNSSLKGIMRTVCEDAKGFQPTLKIKYQVQQTLPESEKRFKETFKNFLNTTEPGFNYESLVSGKLKNQNSKKVTDEVLDLLNSLFAGNAQKPTRTEITRHYDAFLAGYVEVINPETGELFDHKGYQPLSDATIINYLGKWGDRIGTHLKRSGDRQIYRGNFVPYHSMSMPQYAGEIISIDDRQPPFKYSGNDRAWFYLGIDIGSQAWICWVHGKSKEGIIEDFYRQLIRNYTEWGINLPNELECESNLNASYKNTFLREGAMFDNVRIEANNARGKYIERMNGKLRYENEKDKEGWLARPTSRKEDNQAGGKDVPLVPYNQIVENSLSEIEKWNNTAHSEYPNKTRWEVFIEKQHPALKPTNWPAILPYLGYKTQTSCNAGIVKLQKCEFLLGRDGEICFGEPLITLMKEVEGRNLDVYWLDDNDGKVIKALIYHRGGDTLLCEAVAKPIYSRSVIGRGPADEKAYKTMSAYANTIESYGRKRAARIQELVVIDNRESTLNNKFQIKELHKKGRAVVTEEKETEILEEVDELENPTYRKGSDLKDRF